MTGKQEICCPKFEVSKWDNKTFDWNKKPFIKASVLVRFRFQTEPSYDINKTSLKNHISMNKY